MLDAVSVARFREHVENAGLKFTHHETYVCIMNTKPGRKRFMNVTEPSEEKIEQAIEFVRKA